MFRGWVRACALTGAAFLGGASIAAALPPGFLPGWSVPAGFASRGVALGDVDGDLDVDAYVTEFHGPDILWTNDGDGLFSRSPQLLDSGHGRCAALAPLDGDGDFDLWLTRHLASNRSWLNDGTGTFTDSGQSIGGSVSRGGCDLGDVDGDGDLDAFVATDTSTASNELFLNDGAGIFTASAQALGSYFSRDVALGDVDGDGDLDALIGNNGGNKLWRNDGAGQFTDSGATMGNDGTFGVALGDLDDDGDLDAFFANGSSTGDPEEIWLNDGTGTFTDSGQSLGDDYSFSVVLLDCDGDDDLDAFVGNNTGLPNRLYLNDGAGLFADSGQAVGIGGTFSAAASDLDGDFDLDLFLSNSENPEQVLLNDGLCHFSSSGQLLGSSTAESVALGDVDGDGDRDALIGTYGGIVRLLRNDGAGAFADDDQWISPGYGPTAVQVKLADFDGDLDLDAWVGLCCVGSGFTDDPADRVYWNDGTGQFSDSGQLLGSDYTTGVAVGDLDGDLDLDIVTSSWTSLFSPGENRFYVNDGAGTFSQGAQAVGSGNHRAVALADLDGDADLDLIFGRDSGARVWRNNGNLTFTQSPQTLGATNVFAVALGDLDGDGDRDAYLANDGADTVWRNGGNGIFVDSGQALGSTGAESVHLFDADGDSDLDAWTTHSGGGCGSNQLWLNDGTGLFSDSGWAIGCATFGESAMADLDGDGDLDWFLASFEGDHQVWLNQLAGPIFDDGFEDATTDAWSSVVP